MNITRRELVAGLGLAAVGGGAVLGTVATTRTEVTRPFDVGVVTDDAGQIQLSQTGVTDAVRLEEVGDDGLEVLTFDFAALNDQADTRFGAAFRITNDSAVGEPLWIHAPRALDADDNGVTDAVQESVEFLVDSTDTDVLDTEASNPGGLVDFSLPPEYPSVFSANPGSPDATSGSTLGKVTETGAFLLAHGGSVDVVVRVLDFPLDPAESASYLFRLAASRTAAPVFPDDWNADPTISVDGGGGR